MNNLKVIRELYGATQEEIAQVTGVNRVTVSQWERGAIKASDSKLEKLSIFYGVGPEWFYTDKVLTEEFVKAIKSTARRAREADSKKQGDNKVSYFTEMFNNVTFKDALGKYMFSVKVMLTLIESATEKELEDAILVNKKLNERLEHHIKLRKDTNSFDELFGTYIAEE